MCEVCKNKKATFHLTSIEAGKKKETHLCAGCVPGSGINLGMPAKQSKKDGEKCKVCEMTLGAIKEKVRVGCHNCYEQFKTEINDLLKKIHGTSEHSGKAPQGAPKRVTDVESLQKQVEKLKEELGVAIKAEMYEQAAALRDQIKEINSKLELEKEAAGKKV